MYTEHNSALMDLSMTAFLAESMTDATTEWNKLHPSYVPILKDVESLIGPNEKFDRFITEFHRLEVFQQAIICRWFGFFTHHHSSCVCIYKAIIQALIELSDSNAELLFLQSTFEQTTSFAFFDILFRQRIFLDTSSVFIAKYLLTIAFVYGYYPGMQLRPFAQAAACIRHELNMVNLVKLFEVLFVKYENPRLFTQYLEKLSFKELECLMFVLQGNNIRNYRNLPNTISKKESFQLITLNCFPHFTDSILLRSIAIIKLMSINDCPSDLRLFCLYSRVYRYRIKKFIEQITYWKRVYEFISGIDWEYTILQYEDFVYFFEREIETYNHRSFLRNHISMHGILDEVLSWYISGETDADLTKLEWEPQDQFSRFEISFGKYQYLFEQLTSGQALAVESEIMNNCVFQFYLTGCAKGWGAIWSMQKKKESGYVKCLTIHVQKTFIVEIAGRSNHKAGRKQMKIVREWARQIGFTVFDDDLYPRVDLAV